MITRATIAVLIVGAVAAYVTAPHSEDYAACMNGIRQRMALEERVDTATVATFLERCRLYRADTGPSVTGDDLLNQWDSAFLAVHTVKQRAMIVRKTGNRDTLSVTSGQLWSLFSKVTTIVFGVVDTRPLAQDTAVRWLVLDTLDVLEQARTYELQVEFNASIPLLDRGRLKQLLKTSKPTDRSPIKRPPRLSALLRPGLHYSVEQDTVDGIRSIRLDGYAKHTYTSESSVENDSVLVAKRSDWKDFQDLRFLSLWDDKPFSYRTHYEHHPTAKDADTALEVRDVRYWWMQKRMPYKTIYENGLEIRTHHFVEEPTGELAVTFRQRLLLNLVTDSLIPDVQSRPDNH